MGMNTPFKKLFESITPPFRPGRIRRFLIAFLYVLTALGMSLLLWRVSGFSLALVTFPILLWPFRSKLLSRLLSGIEIIYAFLTSAAIAFLLYQRTPPYRWDPSTIYIPEAKYLLSGSLGLPTVLPTNIVADSIYLPGVAIGHPIARGYFFSVLTFLGIFDFILEYRGAERAFIAFSFLLTINHVSSYIYRRLGFPDHVYALILLATVAILLYGESEELVLTLNLLVLGKQLWPAAAVALVSLTVPGIRLERKLVTFARLLLFIRLPAYALAVLPAIAAVFTRKSVSLESLLRRLDYRLFPAGIYLALAIMLFGSPLGYRGLFSEYAYPVPRLWNANVEFLYEYSGYFEAVLIGIKKANEYVNRLKIPQAYVVNASVSVAFLFLSAMLLLLYKFDFDELENALLRFSAIIRGIRLLGNSRFPRQAFVVLITFSLIAAKSFERLFLASFYIGFQTYIFMTSAVDAHDLYTALYGNLPRDYFSLLLILALSLFIPQFLPKKLPRGILYPAVFISGMLVLSAFMYTYPIFPKASFATIEASQYILEHVPEGSLLIYLYHDVRPILTDLKYEYRDLYKADLRIKLKPFFEEPPDIAAEYLLARHAHLLLPSRYTVMTPYILEGYLYLTFSTNRMRRFAVGWVVYHGGYSIITPRDRMSPGIIAQNVTANGYSVISTRSSYEFSYRHHGYHGTYIVYFPEEVKFIYAKLGNVLYIPYKLLRNGDLLRIEFPAPIEELIIIDTSGAEHVFFPL